MRDKLNPKGCQKWVNDPGRSVGMHQCFNKPKKDGYCMMHHPDVVKKREEEREKRWKKEEKQTTWYKLGEEREKNKKLENKLKRVRKVIKICGYMEKDKINREADKRLSLYHAALRDIAKVVKEKK